MKTLSIGSNGIIERDMTRPSMVRNTLLICGIASSLLYVAINILGAMQWVGYDSISQAFSELIAIDAPSRSLAVPLAVIYAILIYAFGAGIWQSAGDKRILRVAAVLIIMKEVFGLVVTLFAPIHLRGVQGTQSDTFHGILTIMGVFLCMFPAMGLGAAALGKNFRLYTIGTMLIFLVCGILAGSDQPRYVANLPTPYMGLNERILIYGYLLWIAVLAAILLRTQLDNGNTPRTV